MAIWLLTLLFAFSSLSLGQEELPFWRQKKHLMSEITNNRKIVVGVKKEELETKERKFRMVGVGAVNVPLNFCVQEIQKFEQLKNVSSYFKVVRHIKEKKQIYLKIVAMGYQARLRMEYKLSPVSKSREQQLDWRVVWGTFKGMVGHFKFREISDKQTEVAMWSHFKADKLPIPAFFLRFTLEVIAEKVAQKMRSYLEENYRRSQKDRAASSGDNVHGRK